MRLPRRCATRNDNLLYEIAQSVPSEAKESSTRLAMTKKISLRAKRGNLTS